MSSHKSFWPISLLNRPRFSLGSRLIGVVDLCFKIEEVNISVINSKLRISLGLSAGYQFAPNSFHNLYRVTLKNGETWAVDTTGAQFGYMNPLCPWKDFVRNRSSKVNREHEFGYIRHRTYQSYAKFPLRHMVAQTIEKQELVQMLGAKISALAEEQGGKLNAILRGSDAAFNQTKDRFLNRLDDYLRMSMTKMYTPDQIARRGKEIDCQLSQNLSDPDRQKELEGLTQFTMSAALASSGSAISQVDAREIIRGPL